MTTIHSPKFVARDASGALIGVYDERDVAAGACQDASREAGDDGEGYTVTERADSPDLADDEFEAWNDRYQAEKSAEFSRLVAAAKDRA